MTAVRDLNRMGFGALTALGVGFVHQLPAVGPAPPPPPTPPKPAPRGSAAADSIPLPPRSAASTGPMSAVVPSTVGAVPLTTLRLQEAQRVGKPSTLKLAVSTYRQNDPEWEKDRYRWAPAYPFGHVGCTLTATTNLLNYTYPEANGKLTPPMANEGNALFQEAMRNTKLVDLSGNGVNRLDSFGEIKIDSEQGRKLIEAIKESIAEGRPVVVGIVGGKKGTYPRHSLTALGIDGDGNVLIADPWRKAENGNALITTLEQAIEHHGRAVGFDIALSGSRR
jgi:hypothetical protein